MTATIMSSAPLHIDLGVNFRDRILVRVTGASGEREHLLTSGDGAESVGSSGRIDLIPQHAYTRAINLAPDFAFTTPGKCFVTIALPSGPAGSAYSTSNTVDVIVLERDKVALARLCKRLVKEIQATEDVGTKLELIAQFAQIHDPVAVPFIKQLLAKRPPFSSELYDSLVAIDDEDSIEVLHRAFLSTDVDDAYVARSRLMMLNKIGRSQQIRDRAASSVRSLPPLAHPPSFLPPDPISPHH